MVATKTRLDQPTNDVAYWLSQPPEARLAALEEIRQEYIRSNYKSQPRFQRVCSIVELVPRPSPVS
ncbi:MAG: hypothetical protein H7062_19820 [Candidatus Saccharimonas sp.]|nr:hypothetical protein [Planctomycetaceae bacterium]